MSGRFQEPKKKRTGLIVGIIIAIVVVLIIVGILIWFLLMQDSDSDTDPGDAITCTSDVQCPLDFRCQLSTNICVICIENGDCTSQIRPVCKIDSGVCVGCITDDDCDGNDQCGVDFLCHECLNDNDCTDPEVCSQISGGGDCVQCRSSVQCGMGELCIANLCV